MKTNTVAPVQDHTIHLTNSDARTARVAIDAMFPPVGEPVDYEDCLLLGVWGRLRDGERTFPVKLWSTVQAHIKRGSRPTHARDRSPSRTFTVNHLHDLMTAVMFHHVALLVADQEPLPDRPDEALLIDEGLTLAILAGRCYYSGTALMSVLADRRRALADPESHGMVKANRKEETK